LFAALHQKQNIFDTGNIFLRGDYNMFLAKNITRRYKALNSVALKEKNSLSLKQFLLLTAPLR